MDNVQNSNNLSLSSLQHALPKEEDFCVNEAAVYIQRAQQHYLYKS